jgi:hypothetical protein
VAKAGRPVRPPFNLAPQTVFTTDVAQLAAHPERYRITAAGSRPAASGVPAATCFALRARAGTAKPRAPRGTYCFSASGALTAVTYPSGNTLRMVSLRLRTPPKARFRPYAHPTPLP